jgi:hypothetical protein
LKWCDVGWLVLLSLLTSAAAVEAITLARRGLSSWCKDGEAR